MRQNGKAAIRTAIAALALGVGLVAFGGTAFADPPWAHDGWHHHWRDHGWYRHDDDDRYDRGYPPPVIYAPPPPPVYYAPPPPPVYYAPPALSFGINIPLGGDRDRR